MITDLTITELAEGLGSGNFSSVEVTKAFLERAEAFKDLNAFVRVTEKEALIAAEAADKEIKAGVKKPLLGVPVGVKDVILTKGIETACSSNMLKGFIPPYESTVSQKLKDAGAVFLGKLNMDEFAMGSSNENSFDGPVKNPWNKSCVPGGSSGGSAAAVSARLVPAALGTDTGGSIRQPASYCGITGLKPTYGRVSRYGVIAYASSLDQVGPLAHTAQDCARMAEVISGYDAGDSTSVNLEVPDFQGACGQDIKGLRIGVPKEYFVDELDADVKKAVESATKRLEAQGAEIVEISLPHTKYAIASYYIIASAEASSNLSRYDGVRFHKRAENTQDLQELYTRSRTEGFGEEVKRRIMIGTYVLSAGYYDAYYLRAQKVRKLIASDFQNAFNSQCDAIICPAAPSAAFGIGEKTDDPLSMYLSDIFTVPVNLAGLPAMTVPCGFDSRNMPIGVQLIGKAWEEETLFKLAAAHEEACDLDFSIPEKG